MAPLTPEERKALEDDIAYNKLLLQKFSALFSALDDASGTMSRAVDRDIDVRDAIFVEALRLVNDMLKIDRHERLLLMNAWVQNEVQSFIGHEQILIMQMEKQLAEGKANDV
jgi:hypothetical protein